MNAPSKDSRDWRTILSLGVSGLGIIYFLVQTLSIGFLWVTDGSQALLGMDQPLSYGLLIWSSILSGAMLIPIFLLSLYQFQGQDIPGWLDTSRPLYRKIAMWAIASWPLVVLIGWLVAGNPNLAPFLLGLINVLVAGLPILWIYTLASKGIERGHQVRQWQIFGFSLTITPFIVIIVELIAIAVLGGLGFVWVSYRIAADPTLERDLLFLYNQVALRGRDVDALLEFVQPYLLQPPVIAWALVLFAGVVPVVEEVFKSLALWPLAGRRLSPQEGFAAGLLCGAGFAFMENVLYFTAAITAWDWLFIALGRAGTGVLHMLASGLVGWGLASAWRDGKWFTLGLNSLIAFLLHGLWNAIALVTGFASLVMLEAQPTIGQDLLYSAPTVVLFVLSVISILLINRHFRMKNGSISAGTEENLQNDVGSIS